MVIFMGGAGDKWPSGEWSTLVYVGTGDDRRYTQCCSLGIVQPRPNMLKYSE